MNKLLYKYIAIGSLLMILAFSTLAQMPRRPVKDKTSKPSSSQSTANRAAVESESDSTLYYVLLLLLVGGLVGAIGWKVKSKKKALVEDKSKRKPKKDASLKPDKEMEWLRKHSNALSKSAQKSKKQTTRLSRPSRGLNKSNGTGGIRKDVSYAENKAKLDRIKFSKLPINAFSEVKPAKRFDPLPVSNDNALMTAIEQTQDEFEEDEAIRELAIRILARFKNKNSVEAISQVALYDLSASLRSKAIVTLAEFDHESVFETVLLGCADPSREVRAAAAKALFQLNFNRADAWARIVQSDDDYRIIQAAKAAVESGFVGNSISRLVHDDYKYAYEAFTLLSLLIKAGETKELFLALEGQSDNNTKLAILRVFEVLKDERVLEDIYSYMERNSLPEDLSKAANEVINSCDLVPA